MHRVVEGEERLDQVRELEDGAGSTPRVQACVRRLPLDHDRETSNPFAGGLELPRGAKRGLHNERPLDHAREPTDVPCRLTAPDLLVGVDEDHRREGGFRPRSRSAPRAKTICASPPFMS
jgi:hypothetical protein